MRLKDKVAIVVGAGQTPGETIGNGRATAMLFAHEGARVVLVDCDYESAIETQSLIEHARKVSNMKDNESMLPDLAKILAQALQHIEPGQRPVLLAALERLAGQRYRVWANEHPDPAVKEGLLACAEREEEIARRVELLHPNAAEIQNKLLTDHPELLELNRTLFEGRPLKDQFTMQAQGERAGAAAWKAYAAAAADPSAQELLQSCSSLEEANAAFLQSL